MNNPVAVIGLGPNSLEIPLLIFGNKEEAVKHLEGLGLAANKNGSIQWFLPEAELMQHAEDPEGLCPATPLLLALFKDGNYYGGCGECDSLVIREIEFGKPIVSWDLD